MSIALKAENVSIRYITGDFKDIGIKEYVVRKLTNNYHVNEFMAVDGVSFELENGDMLGIIGANGAGKSTLLKAVAGIMEPTQGKITANGEVAALLELGSGFDGDLTVKENAYLRGAMLGYTKDFMDATYGQIIDFAELRDFEDRPFKQLSSGMKSRLAFSIASLVKPDILILDEVLSVGDGAFQEKSAKKMREIISQGATTILVSHSLSQIRELCNKVLWLDHGRQIAFGETQEICDRYARFLDGEPIEKVMNATARVGNDLSEVNTHEERRPDDVPEQTQQKLHAAHRVDWKKVVPGFGLTVSLLAVISCMLIGVLSEKLIQNDTITITAIPETGIVSFRGAMVDGCWYNTADVVVSSGNWQEDPQTFIFTAIDDSPLVIQLPYGISRTLTFDVGAGKGNVRIQNAGETTDLVLYREFESELGLPFDIGGCTTNPVLLYVVQHISFIGLLFIFTAMLFALSLLRKQASASPGQNASAKNGTVEALRFLFIICVCIHHYGVYCPAGYLGVDFSFVLSGFLLMRHFEHNRVEGEDAAIAAVRYWCGRVLRLLPPYLFAYLLTVILFCCRNTPITLSFFMNKSIWELLFLQGGGLSVGLVVGPGWFCGTLVLASFVIYFLLGKSKQTYLYFIAPLSFVLIFSFILQKTGNLNHWDYIGTLRGFTELGLGCICFQICAALKDRLQGKRKLLSSIIEVLSIAYLIYVMTLVGPSEGDFSCVLVIAVLIISLFIGNSYFSRFMNKTVFSYLGKISMGIYLNHIAISYVKWDSLFPVPWNWSLMAYLVFTVLFSCVSTALVDESVNRVRARCGDPMK